MKYNLVAILIILSFLITNKVLTRVESEHYVVTTPKTFESEINRLAIKYNKPVNVAKEVIRCEGLLYKTSGNNKNYDKYGNVWSTDIGWWQLNDYYHKESAKRLGLDINNEWDNLEYGFILWTKEGLKPWKASEPCWSKSI